MKKSNKPSLAELRAEIDKADEYTLEELVPLPAKCPKCKYNWIGRDVIMAPSLSNVYCFFCGAKLRAHPDYPGVIDAVTVRRQSGKVYQVRMEL